MKDIHIAGTGIWYPEDTISNDEMSEVIGSDINEVKCVRKRIL